MNRRASAIRLALLLLLAGMAALGGSYALQRGAAESAADAGLESAAAAHASEPLPDRIPSRDWPGLLGPHQDGSASLAAGGLSWPTAGPRVLWRRAGGAGYSTPTVCGNQLVLFYRQGDEEILESMDAETGQTRWRFAYPTSYKCPYEYSHGPYSTPALDGERVYAIGAEGVLHCVSAADGALLWRHDLLAEYQIEPGFFAFSSSPLVEKDLVLVHVGQRDVKAGLAAFDARTGKERWRALEHGASYATPVATTLHGQRVVLTLSEDGLGAVAPATGQELFSFPFRAKNPEFVTATSPLICDNRVLLSGYSLGSVCLTLPASGGYEELWRDRRVLQSQYRNLLSLNDRLFGWAQDRTFRAIEWETGELIWTWPEEGETASGTDWPDDGPGRDAAPILVGNEAVMLGEDGRLGVFRLDGPRPELLRCTALPLLAGPCFTSPALAQGKLYLRNEFEVVCVLMGRHAGE